MASTTLGTATGWRRSVILGMQAVRRRMGMVSAGWTLEEQPTAGDRAGATAAEDLWAGGDELGAARRFMASHWREEAS